MNDTGFIYQLICAVTQGMSMIVMGVCLERLLTGRDNRISRRKRSVLWLVLSMVLAGIKCLFLLPAIYVDLGTPVVMSLCIAFFLKYCYSDKGWIKFTHTAVLLIQNVLADVIYQSVWGMVDVEVWQKDAFTTRSFAKTCTMVAAISIMINISYTLIVLKIQKKKKIKTSPVWVAVMLLILLMFGAMYVIQASQGFGEAENWSFILCCILPVIEFSIWMLYLSQWEKQEAQDEVGKLHRVMELEKVHYEQIEARREEMAKIRHDYNNVITSVLFLIENNRTDEAGNVIKDLSERMSRTREDLFCKVPIINAVLREKQKQCEIENISLTVDLRIPDIIAVTDLDLCMAFGNLMDNAIRSCREVRALGKACSITLNAGIAQEYLIVKCQNTSLENHEKKIKGTGYGHKILADIAGKYDGDFQTAYENGIFYGTNQSEEYGRTETSKLTDFSTKLNLNHL